MTTYSMKRTRTVMIRCSDEEHQRLTQIAKHHALSVAGVVRTLVKKEADRITALRRARKP